MDGWTGVREMKTDSGSGRIKDSAKKKRVRNDLVGGAPSEESCEVAEAPLGKEKEKKSRPAKPNLESE